ncbi:MAG: hypothetical protein DRN15_05785 [Thermoprotei archaeon]|nr:MAG: hypothetical protein DRN15_05785 [Thermoprotei archaeon]RLF24795.1 MAG: hypothetical protein DRM97_02985 [Thermoprotei archaeon]
MQPRSRYLLAALGVLLAWSIASSSLALYYYQKSAILEQRLSEVSNKFSELLEEYNTIVARLRRANATLEEYERVKRVLLRVDILINYGNGTKVWYNDTLLLAGSTAFEALLRIASVNYTLGAYGVFVRGINGVVVNKTHGWIFAVYGRSEPEWGMSTRVDNWVYPGVAADRVVLEDGDVIAWYYYPWAKLGWPPPPPA